MSEEEYTNISSVSSNILNRRYEYAAGLFFQREDLEQAISDLEENDFPMKQLTIVAGKSGNNSGIADVITATSQYYDFVISNIPDDIANYYNHRLDADNYLVVLHGTGIFLAAAPTSDRLVEDFPGYLSKTARFLSKTALHLRYLCLPFQPLLLAPIVLQRPVTIQHFYSLGSLGN